MKVCGLLEEGPPICITRSRPERPDGCGPRPRLPVPPSMPLLGPVADKDDDDAEDREDEEAEEISSTGRKVWPIDREGVASPPSAAAAAAPSPHPSARGPLCTSPGSEAESESESVPESVSVSESVSVPETESRSNSKPLRGGAVPFPSCPTCLLRESNVEEKL